MKKFITTRVLPLLLACLMFLLPSCNRNKDQEDPLEEGQIAVTWHMGKVASGTDRQAPNSLIDGEEGYSYSDVIHLEKPGTKITFTDRNNEDGSDRSFAGRDVYVISHWITDENGAYVLEMPGDHYTGLGGRAAEVVKLDRDSAVYTYISSFPDEYIRLCYYSGQTAENTKTIKFAKVYTELTRNEGTLRTSDNGETYKQFLVNRFLATSKNDQWHDVLSGITMYAMGDSYFGGSKNGIDYVWPNLLAQKYQMNFKNYGIGGSTVSNAEGNNSNPMCARISKMANGNPDIILFEGGRNDFSRKIPIGADDSTDVSTFCGAINNCLDQLQAQYPNALIIGVTVWARDESKGSQTQGQFGEALMRVCAARGLPCFNAMDKEDTKVDMDSSVFRQTYCQASNDVSHLNTEGMILVEPAFERYIAEQYAAFLSKK